MSDYLLSEGFLSGAGFEIDESRFNCLVRSNKILRCIWDGEESFSLLASSFLELEEYLLGISLKYNFQRDMQRNSEDFFYDARQNINLKLISALTASRAYEEQQHRRASALSEIEGTALDLKSIFSSAFGESLEYRVMYALRNHSLHNQLPLGLISFLGKTICLSGDIRDEGPSRHRVTVDPKITVTEFCNSDKIRPATRDEVSELQCEYLDLKYLARGFLARLAICHDEFRKSTELIMEAALKELRDAQEELMKFKGSLPKYIHVYRIEEGKEVEKHYADYSQKLRLRELRQHWSGLKYIQRSFVSSEIVASKGSYPKSHESLWIST